MNQHPYPVRAVPRTLLILALSLGIFGVTRVSKAAYPATSPSSTLTSDLMAAGDTSGSVTAATLTQLENALKAETMSFDANQTVPLNNDLSYVFATLPASTSLNDYMPVNDTVLAALTLTGAALSAEYQQIGQATTADASTYTAAYQESAGNILSTEAVHLGTTYAIPSISVGISANYPSNDALIAEDTAYPLYQAGLSGSIPAVYEATAVGMSEANQIGLAQSISGYYNYRFVALTTSTGIEAVAITSPANAPSVTGSFSAALPAADAPYLAAAAAQTPGATTTTIALVSGSAAAAQIAQAAAIGTQVASSVPANNANAAAITQGIDMLSNSTGLTDATRSTVAQDVIAVDGVTTGVSVAGAAAPYISATNEGAFAAAVSQEITSGTTPQYGSVAALSSTIASAVPVNDANDLASVAENAAYPLKTHSQSTASIVGVFDAVAATNNQSLATQIAIAGLSGSNSNYTAYATPISTTIEGANVANSTGSAAMITGSFVAGLPVTEAPALTATSANIVPGSAYAITTAGASGQTLGTDESIALAVDEAPNISSSPAISGTVAVAAALSAPPQAPGKTINDTLYEFAQTFGSASGAGQIVQGNDPAIAVALASQAVPMNGQDGSDMANDTVAAIATAFTSELGSSTYLTQVLQAVVKAFPLNAADVLGSVLATLPSNSAETPQQLYADAVNAFNTTSFAQTYPGGVTAADQFLAEAYADYQKTNHDGYYGGLTPEETPVVDE